MDGNKIVEIATGVLDKYDVYVVNGKVICFTPDVLDMANPKDVDEVLTLSEVLYEEKGYPAIHGRDTMCVLVKHSGGEHYMISMACISDLPENVQAKVRMIVEEYHSLQALYKKNQITEIGGNVYVINKKPVYIYPGAIDLGKAADVDEVCRLVCDADMAESLNCFGEDTMLVLGTEPEDGYYNISIGDIETLPDDIMKKVKAEMSCWQR